MYYVYRFLDESQNVIYVGKSKQELETRFIAHSHLPIECYAMVNKIEFIACSTESDMSIKEIYYINKYKNSEHYFFNILDTTELPQSVFFNDDWEMYRGPLPAQFSNSINFTQGYTTLREARYNKDGSINKRKQNKEKGISSFVDGLTKDEVDLVINYLINELNEAKNNNQEQIRFRNLVMFVLGVNLPLKTSDFLSLKYKDLFDENDCVKPLKLKLGRFQQEETISIPLKSVVSKTLYAYACKFNLSYKNNAEDDLCQSREHQIITAIAWGSIIKRTVKAIGIEKNVGAETIRKTYGFNVYTHSSNKLNALLFLGKLWGEIREVKLIKYLGLADEEDVDFEYYLGEGFSLGDVDLSKIKCLKK